jgi:NADH-quinone oxidoreductase subunit F
MLPVKMREKLLFKRPLKQELGITVGQTTPDGLFTLESVNCLAPAICLSAIKIDDTIYATWFLKKWRVLSVTLERNIKMSNRTQELIFNIDPNIFIDFEDYLRLGGYSGLTRALAQGPERTLQEIIDSGLRGRGGAAFPAGKKIELVRANSETTRFIICNADEGEPGTFKDRFIMTHIPFQLLEGITIAAYLAGASQGYIYVRHEYPEAQKILKSSIRTAIEAGYLGEKYSGKRISA